jgi:hypothetical protein
VTVVEIPEGDTDSNFHIWTTTLARLMAEMTPTAEEAGEEVEGIMVLPAPATLLTLLEPLVSILVVDFAGFRDGESFVGFGDFDEFLFGRFIAPGFLSMGLWGQLGKRGRTGSYLGGISCLVFCMRV